MKTQPYLILVLLPLLLGCTTPAAPQDTEKPGETQQPEEQQPENPQVDAKEIDLNVLFDASSLPGPEPVVVAQPYVVTSEIMLKFIREVTYDERDYTYTHVTDEAYAPYGAPGTADMPPTVPISWENPAGGTPVLQLQEAESGWWTQRTLKAGATSCDLSNLVPGCTYHWAVMNGNPASAVLARGTFTTTGLVHQVYFPSKVRNARDLGGWTTTDGKKLAYRKLYRGGDVGSSYLSAEGKKLMLAEGIKAELDLREAKDAPSSSVLGKDIAFYNADLDKSYGGMIREYKPKVKACFQFIVKCLNEDKPVYFHCSIGRDRTGTTAALLLGVLGVSESDISKEYELLFFSPKDWSLNGGKTEFDYSRAKKYALGYCNDTLWEQGGAALGVDKGDTSVSFKQRCEAYLLDIGVTQKEIDDFRRIMLD